VIAWLTGRSGAGEHGEALIWTGIGAIVLGSLAVTGQWQGTREVRHLFSRSASDQGMAERTRQAVQDLSDVYVFILVMGTAGSALVLAGVLLLQWVR
jgi:hypothetical protein